MKVIPPLLILIVGLIPLGVALGYYSEARELIRNYVPARGKVVGYVSRVEDMGDHNSTLYYPKVEFVDASGKSVRFESKVGTGGKPYQHDDEVEVLYNPEDPSEGVINSFMSLWLKPSLFVVIGIPIALLGGTRLIRTLLDRRVRPGRGATAAASSGETAGSG